MKHNLEAISYTLAAVAGVCFVGGLFVLTGGDLSHVELGRSYRNN